MDENYDLEGPVPRRNPEIAGLERILSIGDAAKLFLPGDVEIRLLLIS
ncbi:MAG: hypothetical protein MK181_05225 [Acidimicrobiales bacterium]|nr:hypothetical protein [Acidimicrobiales bacterium]